MSPVEILLATASIGGQLGIRGEGLLTRLPRGCNPDLKTSIRSNKSALVDLLRLNFLVVQSAALKEPVFWCATSAVKQALVAAGANAGCVYTADELGALIDHRATAAELVTIHATKKVFEGRINTP